MKTNKTKLYNLQESAVGGDGGGADFNGERPITRNTPGLIGVTPGGNDLVEFLEHTFYPAVAPAATMSVNNPTREIGQDPDFTLTWAATRNTNPITGITVDGNVITPTGNTQSGTQDGATADVIGADTMHMSVTDGTLTSTAEVTITYLPRIFWGTTAKNGGSAPILDADILALAGSELRADRLKTFTNFGGSAKYLIFAFPTSYGTPAFKVNGLNNTAFTKVRSYSAFVNAEGYTINMDVWVSNNLYNSPLDSVEIA